MLTIEQLRAMPEGDRAGYLGQVANEMKHDEIMAVQARNEERRARDVAVRREAYVEEARAYFATLEAAGLWPLPKVPA